MTDDQRDEALEEFRENKPSAVHCLDSTGNWRWIRVDRRIILEDFLPIICYDPNKAARFILDWASSDMASAAQFMLTFLAKVFNELYVDSSYLSPKQNVQTSFGNRRPSVSELAFNKFCELLIENPELIKQFRNSPGYPHDSQEDRRLFGDRKTSLLALTRGITWDESDFKDSCPVPLHLKLKYQKERKQADESYREAQKLKEEAERKTREENKKKKKQERYAVSQANVEKRMQESVLRKIERDKYLQKSIIEQVRLLALDETRPLKAFPIDLAKITSDVLEELDMHILDKLSNRIHKQWQKPWKELAQKIDVLRNK